MLERSRSTAAAPGRGRDGSFAGELLALVLGHEKEMKRAWVSAVNKGSNEVKTEGEKKQQRGESTSVVYLGHGRGRR